MTVTLGGKEYRFTHPPERKRMKLMRKANTKRLQFEATQRVEDLDDFYQMVLWKYLKFPRGKKAEIEAECTPDELNDAVCKIWRIEQYKVPI